MATKDSGTRFCDGCGSTKVVVSIGGAMLCKTCDVDVQDEIKKIRASGKPVNALHIARRMFKEDRSAGNYLLRDIPAEMWKEVEHRAVDEGGSIRDIILKALHGYLAKK